MSKKKNVQTSTYSQITPNETRDTAALRDLIQKTDFSTSVNNAYGQLDKQIGDEYLPDDITPEADKRIRSGKLFNNRMSRGMALSNAKQAEHEYKTGAMASLAAGTAPRIVQTGGTSTQSGGLLGDILVAGVSGAGAAA